MGAARRMELKGTRATRRGSCSSQLLRRQLRQYMRFETDRRRARLERRQRRNTIARRSTCTSLVNQAPAAQFTTLPMHGRR